MKKFSSILITIFFLLIYSLTSIQSRNSKAMIPSKPGCTPNAFIILDPIQLNIKVFIAKLEGAGGCALHIFPPSTIIGFIPPEVQASIHEIDGIKKVHYSEVNEQDMELYSTQVRLAANSWNHLVNPPPPQKSDPNAPKPQPLVNDVFSIEQPIEPSGNFPQALNSPGYTQVSEFMAGSVAVGIILPESNGTTDPNTENWDGARMASVFSKIFTALNWWSVQNPRGGMSFYYDIHSQVPTQYEPISRSSTQDGLWIDETLSSLGYSGAHWWDKAYSYINTIRASNNTDWGVAIYVADSLNDSDGRFTDGYFGYSYGFLIVMTYDNDGWGIGNMDSVMAHEFGHNFGAADEYCQPSYACCWGSGFYGYLGVPNLNCEAKCDQYNAQATPIPNSICDGDDHTPGSNCHNCTTCVMVNCLYRNGGISFGLDVPSQMHVGIRDSDGDNILDPADTIPYLTLNAYVPDPTNNNTPFWMGSTLDAPFPSPTRPPVSINYINRVEFRIDGGVWNSCTADDGGFNQTSENFTCLIGPTTNPPTLPDGNHTIGVRSRNRVLNYSMVVTDTLTVDTTPPTNPTTVNPGCTAANNAWQNTCSDPNFTWSGASDGSGSGVAGYYYYWGTDSNGTSSNWTVSPSYDPPAVPDPSIYYLRVQTKDNVGNISNWNTLFILKYDNTAPSSTITSFSKIGCGPAYMINWNGTDLGSGIASYDIQYRVALTGTWTNWLTGTLLTSAQFGPSLPITPIPNTAYYFRVRAYDSAGNVELYPGGNGDLWFTAIPYCAIYLPITIK